jgi:hypothetical protein
MPEKIDKWSCCICNDMWETELQAIECERKHNTKLNLLLIDCYDYSCFDSEINHIFPMMIEVEGIDGQSRQYKLMG